MALPDTAVTYTSHAGECFDNGGFVDWFRAAAPYIHAFRGKTFVIAFGGEVLAEQEFVDLAHDLNLLVSLGVRVVIVPGDRPQVEAALQQRQVQSRYHHGRRVTDLATMEAVKQAVGQVRVDIETLLSMGLPNSPMEGAAIRVASGNFVIARPLGVLAGIDMEHTGIVRRIQVEPIRQRLDAGEIVMLQPIGFSPTGESFNLTLEDVATEAAIALQADKLIFLADTPGLQQNGQLLRELTAQQADDWFRQLADTVRDDTVYYVPGMIDAVRGGVGRAHLISRHVDGALLQELFTRAGVGTMLTRDPLGRVREASIDDVGGILALIEPLEAAGILVKRSRERLEMEIERFMVLEHDRAIIGCGALYPYPEARMAELACLVVDKHAQGTGHGEHVLAFLEQRARDAGCGQLFALTTQTAHWFVEHGFRAGSVADLPPAKQEFYNWQRRSQVFLKPL